MGFFKNLIKAREEWLSNSSVPNTATYLNTNKNVNTNVKSLLNEKSSENAKPEPK
jgi:hypothetical protein